MGARGSTTLMIMINVVVVGATTTIGVVATELFIYLPRVRVLGSWASSVQSSRTLRRPSQGVTLGPVDQLKVGPTGPAL